VPRIGRAPPRIATAAPVGTRLAGTIGMRARIDLLLGLVCASLTFVGCGNSGVDAAECQGALGEVGQGCPTMFDGAPENVPPCKRLGVQQVWTCDDVIALSLGAGAYGVDCYYGSSSHVLIGAMAVNDTNTLCGNSFTRSAGEVPTAACRFPVIAPTFYRSCGGVDSGVN